MRPIRTARPAQFMRAAVQAAARGIARRHGGPFGACLARGGRKIATAHNTVVRDHDPTAHAEMNAIRRAARKLKSFDLSDCVLYSTAEPCPMCLGAIYWARIPLVYTGVSMAFARRYGFRDEFIFRAMQKTKKRFVNVRRALLADECAEVFIKWKRMKGKNY